MEFLRRWLDTARPEQASLAAAAVAVGVAGAHGDALPVKIVPGVLAILAAFAAGVAIPLVDRAWDDASEAADAVPGAASALATAAVLGLAAAWIAGSALLVFGTIAILLGVWRRAPAIGGDTVGFGLGELATLVALGPLAALTGYASQAGEGSPTAFYGGVPVGLAAAAASYSRHFTRRDADAARHRMTPLVSLGERQARLGAVAYPLIAACAVFFAQRAGEYGSGALWAVLPLGAMAFVAARNRRGAPTPEDDTRSERLATVAAVVAILVVAVAAWWGPPA